MNYFNREIETLPIAELRKLQNDRLRHQLQTVYAKVPYYRNLFNVHGVKPADVKTVEDLHKLPFTKKDALRDNYPFGMFAVPVSETARLHCSSGTTGKPIVVGYTAPDIQVFAEVVARSLAAAGCRPGMLMQNAYGYGLFTGGLGIHYGAEKLGMTVLPISGGSTEKQLMLMQDFRSDVLCCTPSYALTLAEEIKKRGLTRADIHWKHAVLGAEPWTESVRQDVERSLGVSATNIYGLTEIIGPGVSQEDFEEKGTGSYIWEDHFFPEVVDKDSGLPVKEGEFGVLVFTTLTKQATPVIRFWTNDITNIYYDKSAKRTHIKMGALKGRADDMLIIRGVNLFHTQIEAILEHFTETLTNNYRLIVSHQGTMDEVEVNVEIHQDVYSAMKKDMDEASVLRHDTLVALQRKLHKKIKDDTGLTMKVALMPPASIPRSEGGKLVRILDLRNP